MWGIGWKERKHPVRNSLIREIVEMVILIERISLHYSSPNGTHFFFTSSAFNTKIYLTFLTICGNPRSPGWIIYDQQFLENNQLFNNHRCQPQVLGSWIGILYELQASQEVTKPTTLQCLKYFKRFLKPQDSTNANMPLATMCLQCGP